MTEGLRVLIVSDDDDVIEPLAAALRRCGHRIGRFGSGEGPEQWEGALPDLLVVDQDLPAETRRWIGDRLAPHTGRNSFPLILLGSAADAKSDIVPPDWHEDAWIAIARPAQPGEFQTAVKALLRLTFYRGYRDLVHDLSQPVTAIHALADGLALEVEPTDRLHDRVRSLRDEAERLMTLMERFQRRRVAL